MHETALLKGMRKVHRESEGDGVRHICKDKDMRSNTLRLSPDCAAGARFRLDLCQHMLSQRCSRAHTIRFICLHTSNILKSVPPRRAVVAQAMRSGNGMFRTK